LKEKLAENIKSDSKSFFAYVRGRSNAAKKLGPLVNSEGEVIDSSEGMSELFNEVLARCLLKRDWVMFPRPNGSMETSRA